MNNGQYGNGNENESTVKFSTDFVKPFLAGYSDAYILVIGDIKVVGANNDTMVAFKNCHPFTKALIRLNDERVQTAYHLKLTMNLYNLQNYSDNFAYTTASLYHYKRPDQIKNNAGEIDNIADNSTSFMYQSELIKKQVTPVNDGQDIDPEVTNAHRAWKNVKIAVPLKWISNFFRAFELPLINTKLCMELTWTNTLSTENEKKLANLLSEVLERLVTWNEYKSKIDTVTTVATEGGNTNTKIILLDCSFQGVSRLFVMGSDDGTVQRTTAEQNSHKRYYLSRREIKDYNVLIDGRNFFDQNINDSVTRYTELLKLTTGRSEDYSTGCLTDFD